MRNRLFYNRIKRTLKRNSSDLTLAEVTANNIDNMERLISAHGVLHVSVFYAYLISVLRLTFIQNEKQRRGEGKFLVNLITMEVTSQGLFTFPYVSFHCFLRGEDFENEGGGVGSGIARSHCSRKIALCIYCWETNVTVFCRS